MFSETVKKYIIGSGWFEGRNINIEYLVSYMLKEGYKVPSSVKSFLKEFGNLSISYLRKNGLSDTFHFDCVKAIDDIFLDNVLHYSERLNNINLCVIGQCYTNHMTLMMDNQGKIFGGYDDYLYKIGNNIEGAIENICLDKTLIEIE